MLIINPTSLNIDQKRSFPRRFKVEYTWCVCRVDAFTSFPYFLIIKNTSSNSYSKIIHLKEKFSHNLVSLLVFICCVKQEMLYILTIVVKEITHACICNLKQLSNIDV